MAITPRLPGWYYVDTGEPHKENLEIMLFSFGKFFRRIGSLEHWYLRDNFHWIVVQYIPHRTKK